MYLLTVWLMLGVVACAVDAIYGAWKYQWDREQLDRRWQRWEADYNRVLKHQRWNQLKKEQEQWKANCTE